MSTDRTSALGRWLLTSACAEEQQARHALRQATARREATEALLARWEAEDAPDGPLFGGPPPEPLPPPKRQAQQRGAVETVKEWWVYRTGTTERLGEVLATAEPAALARAIDTFGRPDVWVACAGEPGSQAPRDEVPAQKAEVPTQGAEVPGVQGVPGPAGEPALPGQPVAHPSWRQKREWNITLADGRPVRALWDPAHRWHDDTTGRLELHGPVSGEGYRGFCVGLADRTRPLEEVALAWAQEAADREAARLAGEARPKQPDWSAARKEDLASGAAKPRVRKRVKKSEAKLAEEAAGEGGGECP